MTWEVSLDHDNGYKFANTIGAVLGKMAESNTDSDSNTQEENENIQEN